MKKPLCNRKSSLFHGMFTLVELLVVLAIIGLLIGLIFPSLSKAKEKARSASCTSNLKQLALATETYTMENQGYYPCTGLILPTPNHYLFWCGYAIYSGYVPVSIDILEAPIYPYLKSDKVLHCPSFSDVTVTFTNGEISGYGINAEYVAGSHPAAPFPSFAKPAVNTQITYPSETMSYMDSAVGSRFATVYDPPRESLYFWAKMKSDDSGPNASASSHFRHAGRANAAFCDGHVEDVVPDELDDEKRNIGWPNRDLCGWPNFYNPDGTEK